MFSAEWWHCGRVASRLGKEDDVSRNNTKINEDKRSTVFEATKGGVSRWDEGIKLIKESNYGTYDGSGARGEIQLKFPEPTPTSTIKFSGNSNFNSARDPTTQERGPSTDSR